MRTSRRAFSRDAARRRTDSCAASFFSGTENRRRVPVRVARDPGHEQPGKHEQDQTEDGIATHAFAPAAAALPGGVTATSGDPARLQTTAECMNGLVGTLSAAVHRSLPQPHEARDAGFALLIFQ